MKKDLENRTFWERVAFLYTPFVEKSNAAAYEELCVILSRYLQKNMRVLELACGTGQFTRLLAGNVKTWEATDFSARMVAKTRRRVNAGNVAFSVQDATRLPYSDETFDAVVIANALHIMPEPEQALAEIRRVLKPGGLLLAPTFVYDGDLPQTKIKLMERIGFHTFHKWTSSEFFAFIREHGFSVQRQSIVKSKLLPECALIGKRPM